MVEKHPLTADYEQLTYTPEMLEMEWRTIVSHFSPIIGGGWANSSVLNLIEYIRNSSYSKILFPGTSLGRLLISKPRNGKLNYQQTLVVSSHKAMPKIELSYSDWDTIDRHEDADKAILWSCECDEKELLEKFKEFIEWNQVWR